MVHIILNATKDAASDCSGVVRAVAKKILEEEKNVLNVRFWALPIPNAHIGASTLVQVDTAADLCPSYLVKDFMFDPMHFLRERMFYRAHFKRELKTYHVQEDVSLRSPVELFSSQICGYLNIPVPDLTMPTFKDDFFESRSVRSLMHDQCAQFSAFWKLLSKEQKDSLPKIFHELDMDFLLDDWVGLVRYIKQRHIKIISKEQEAAFVKPYNFLFNCISFSKDNAFEGARRSVSNILENWGFNAQEETKLWYCSEEENIEEVKSEYNNTQQATEKVGAVILREGEWICL